MTNTEKFQKILDKVNSPGSILKIESEDGNLSWSGSSGNLKTSDQYFIASTTKIYTSSLIFKLKHEGKLDLKDKISKYINESLLVGLNVFNGIDYSKELTVEQLLSHTSGIPDYFQQKDNGVSLETTLTNGHDRAWSFEESLEMARKLSSKFKPGETGRALYSDTNFQLLGKIIENIRGKSIDDVYKEEIFEPLKLQQTYLFHNANGQSPKPLTYKGKVLEIPLAMSSFGPDGGIVSNKDESMIFLKAFFNGFFFPKEYFNELKKYNKIFFPLQYGVGFMRIKLPRIFSPFKPLPELIGHSGLSGAFAFYCPEKQVYITGTVNQISNPSTSFKLMIQIINSL